MGLTFEVPVVALLPGGDQISNDSGKVFHTTTDLSAPLSQISPGVSFGTTSLRIWTKAPAPCIFA